MRNSETLEYEGGFDVSGNGEEVHDYWRVKDERAMIATHRQIFGYEAPALTGNYYA